MFDSIYEANITVTDFFVMAAVALLSGLVYSYLVSFRMRSKRRFFTVLSLIPFVVSAVITFVNGNIGAGVAVGGAFSLIRFRSAQGSADEIAALLIAMGSGIAFGMGFLAYGVIILLGLGVLFVVLSALPIFEHRAMAEEQLLSITIPETLHYGDVFTDTFSRYLKCAEKAGVKTTGMGSMVRLSFRIVMKDPAQEKDFIDELRTKNGNLEISVVPYAEKTAAL